ncbi:hypothetical protein GGF32_008999 [Allomyces javanicus]|nr:hypothetical protein GGF32_008999 [Allomyces javanicus]
MAKVKDSITLVSLDNLLNDTTVDLSRESVSLIRQLYAIPKVFVELVRRAGGVPVRPESVALDGAVSSMMELLNASAMGGSSKSSLIVINDPIPVPDNVVKDKVVEKAGERPIEQAMLNWSTVLVDQVSAAAVSTRLCRIMV